MRVGVLGGMLILALVAVPVLAQPVATENLSATGLSITPQIDFERATFRVSGPDGYWGAQRFESGASIQFDLLTMGRRPSPQQKQGDIVESSPTDTSALPEGRYKYEAVFWANGEKVGVQAGTFFVEGGLAISREAKRAQISDLRGDLMSREWVGANRPAADGATGFEVAGQSSSAESYVAFDQIWITDNVDDGKTLLTMDSDVPSDSQYWSMVNQGGDLYLQEGFTGSDPYRVTFERGGQVGIGTTAPGRPLHVVNPSSWQQVLLTAGYSGYDAELQVGDGGLWIIDNDGESIARFNHDASQATLVVDAAGVGIGTTAPEEDLHVLATDPQILVEATGSNTGRTLAYMKNNGDVRMFWENTTSGDIWQMSLLSTVLQMATPSGNGKFRVRKSGGLQALNGSTEIMALNSTGDLTVKSVTETSSREAKQGFESVDGLSVLEKVASLPISEWSYKADNPSVRHLGPMAEDFHAAFGLGRTDKGLTSVDTSGIALAAIQGLNQKLMEKNAQLEQRIAELEAMMQTLMEH